MRIHITIDENETIDHLLSAERRAGAESERRVREYDVRSAYPSAMSEVKSEGAPMAAEPSQDTVVKMGLNSEYGKLARKRKPVRKRKTVKR